MLIGCQEKMTAGKELGMPKLIGCLVAFSFNFCEKPLGRQLANGSSQPGEHRHRE
jgi:hypothetical protein